METGGSQIVGHVGLDALGASADRLGVGGPLSEAVGWDSPGTSVHDQSRVLTQAMLILAGGSDSCTGIETFAPQDRELGDVCSDTNVYRTFTRTLDDTTVARVCRAMAEVRADVWGRTSATDRVDAVILNIDASPVEIQSENWRVAAARFKGEYGLHPLLCFADATGDTLAGRLRARNAGTSDFSGV